MEAVEVANACAHNRCLEAVGLRYGPCCHKTPIAPTCNANTFSIDKVSLDQIIDAIQNILKILAAHITQDCIGKSGTTTPTPTNIWTQHSKTCSSKHLREILSPIIKPDT
jgi:hypothetical protein